MSTAARIDELRQRFQDNPRRYFASYANELRKLGAYDEAIALCREFLPQVPGHMSGHIVFGQTLFEADHLDEARDVFEQALRQDPENLIALRHLGDIDRRRGDAASARRWYERVLEADPRNDDIAAQLATLTQPGGAATPSSVPSAAPRSVEVGLDAPVMSAQVPAPSATWSDPVDPSDPFRFGAVADTSVDHAEDAEADPDAVAAAFEEGLVAPEWPDTTDLADRVANTRRSDTPPVPAVVDQSVHAAFGGATAFADTDDVPAWLRTPVEPVPAAIAEPVPTPVLEPVAAVAEPIPAMVESVVAAVASVEVESAAPVSFADVHPDVPIVPLAPTPSVAAASARPAVETPVSSPAFVTATMGELFVAQGFLDRAIAVYEELVRQRPDDPSLSRRLEELRQPRAAGPGPGAGSRTVRQRFAALAARRVGGAAPAVGTRVEAAVIALQDDISLDALFGSGGTDADRRAAQVFAEAFKPVSEAPADFLRAMEQLPAQPPMASVATPVVSQATPFAPSGPTSSFDRFFPDPHVVTTPEPPARADVPSASKATDDLAEFSAWLKGLGNP